MIEYGRKKRGPKLHPHDKCDICSEYNASKTAERMNARKEIDKEVNFKGFISLSLSKQSRAALGASVVLPYTLALSC